MKYLVPVIVVLVLLAGVFALWKFKGTTNTDGVQVEQANKEEVIDGNPESTVDAIIKSAEDEASATSSEEEELNEINEDISNLSSMEDVYSDNEY